MSWFSKKLKKVTKVLDPVGDKLRKSTGGSYGDPMNWYNSKPNQTTPYPVQTAEQRKAAGLMAAPNGQTTLPGVSGGANGGRYSYVPNQFSNTPPPMSTPTPPPQSGAMSFGGGQPPPQTGMAPPQQAQMGGPGMQNQMAQIMALRGMRMA